MPVDQPQSENPYFIDAESAAEMTRLMKQDRLTTKSMGGLFPEREKSKIASMHDILDIASGPGGWVLDLAYEYPKIQVTGIDLSRIVVEYARAQARAQGLDNAHFRVMDALKPLDFPDNSFDLVNGRFLSGFMAKTAWLPLVKECLRITRPGGFIRLTELEPGSSTSLAVERISAISYKALYVTGRSFSPDGRNIGITPVLGRFLHDAGCEHIDKMAHVIDCSAGTEAHRGFYENFMVLNKLLQPFLVRTGATTEAEIEEVYQQALDEIMAEDFCAIAFILTAWGQKPALLHDGQS